MKKIMNKPGDVVTDMIRGMSITYPELACFPEERVVARKEKSDKVGLVSGGGSGHEPAHAGFVGKGMLDAAVLGNIFASPSPDQMMKGIQEANSGKGVLFILKNYTGDQMNFSMAKDLAELEDIEVDCVVVKDDVAVPDSTYSAGRRGIAGTVLVHKVTGALAETGAPLEKVKAVAQKAIDRVRTMGLSLSPCVLPGLTKSGFEINDGKLALGMGIHGEPGISEQDLKPSKELASMLLEPILEDYDFINKDTALLINGLGGTPLMELFILAKDVHELLMQKGINVKNVFVGNFMTSLEMGGCSVSLMDLDDELSALISASCDTPGLKQLEIRR